MIMIPKYLKEIAETVDCVDEKLTVKIKCTCGRSKFFVLKNIPKKAVVSKENKEKLQASKKWWKDFEKSIPSDCEYFYNIYADTWDIWVYKKADMEEVHKLTASTEYFVDLLHNGYGSMNEQLAYLGFKEVRHLVIKPGGIPLGSYESFLMEKPDYNAIFKVACGDCGKEYLLFDNRILGNDAVEDLPRELEEYAFRKRKFKSTDYPVELLVVIKNFWDFDDIEGNGNEGLTAEDYSEMFNEIQIKAILPGGKKVAIYSEDLG